MNDVYSRRIVNAQQTMSSRGIDLLIHAASPELQYLTGMADGWRERHGGTAPDAPLVLVPQYGACVLVEGDVRAACAAACRVPVIAMGSEVGESIRHAFDGAEIRDGHGLLDPVRRIKDQEEIAILRRAAALTDAVMAAVVPMIKEGVTAGELEREIERQGMRRGASAVSFKPGALLSTHGPVVPDNPFTYPRDKGIEAGTTVAFDFGFVVEGYSSDYGRSFHVGRAGDELRNAYQALQNAVCGVIAMIEPGRTRCGDLFPNIERLLDKAGYGNYLRARLKDGNLGHQIGIDVHEDPWLLPSSDVVLEPGMVMCIEPKLWHAGEYYIRVEDMVLVGAAGAESLTTFDRGLFEV